MVIPRIVFPISGIIPNIIEVGAASALGLAAVLAGVLSFTHLRPTG
jgi:hypothetical protein